MALSCYSLLLRRSTAFQQSRPSFSRRFTTAETRQKLSPTDQGHLSQAISHAKIGVGHTFPNPAVGCVLVRDDTNEVVGAGFHPSAGYPHAEVFALLEAAGHVDSGIAAARSVLKGKDNASISKLTEQYVAEGGPESLFGDLFESMDLTAYVTLEPCSHHGKTPPCAESLLLSKVNRVVVGFRDPNPQVDGGGVKMLKDAGVQVDMTYGPLNVECQRLVSSFVKRITPNDDEGRDDYSWINGAKRRSLRALAGTRKADGSMSQINWGGSKAETQEEADALVLDPNWMEQVDNQLWDHELVNIRLNKAVSKKKFAKVLGERVASQLQAHVAQTVGHTTLLYRPGSPPVLEIKDPALEEEVEEEETTKAAKPAEVE